MRSDRVWPVKRSDTALISGVLTSTITPQELRPMQPDPRIIARFAECRNLALYGLPHTPESLAQYNAERAREYAKAQARREPHPQQPLPGVA